MWLVDCFLTEDAILTGDVFTHSWSSKALMFLGLLLLVAASVASSGLFSASWIFFLLVSILLVDLLSPRSSTRIIISPGMTDTITIGNYRYFEPHRYYHYRYFQNTDSRPIVE